MASAASLLAIVLDGTSSSWATRTDALTLDQTLRAVMALIRAHYALSTRNQAALLVTTDVGPRVLFAPSDCGDDASVAPLHQVEATVNDRLRQLAHEAAATGVDRLGTFAASLSQLLCIVNRFLRSAAPTAPGVVAAGSRSARVLAVQCSGDDPAQYISTMNAIFCAQKLDVPIDACVLRLDDISFLQQAASITGGVYARPALLGVERSLVQTLLLHFLPDSAARALLNMPQLTLVDMRASCVCHSTMLDVGFVCSVCLSIFCARSPICGTCNARFELPTVGE